MFKKELTAGPRTKLKSSAQRAVRAKVCEAYPLLAPSIDAVIPKKEQLDVVKLPDRTTLYVLPAISAASTSTPTYGSPDHPMPLFYQHMDDALIPHLRLVHAFPTAFPRIRVDRGAVRFVLSGAALMVPGLTSKGGRLPGEGEEEEVYREEKDMAAGEVVVIEAEGKEGACCVGVLKMGTGEMKTAKKGVAMDAGHYLGDGLWKMALE